MRRCSVLKEIVWLLSVVFLVTTLVLLLRYGRACLAVSVKRDIARRIPVEYDPNLKLSCHLSGYTSVDCETLYDRYCRDLGYGFQCDYTLYYTDMFRFLDDRGQSNAAVAVIKRAQQDLIRSVITPEEQALGLPPLDLPVFNLSSSPDLAAEYRRVADAAAIFNVARNGRIHYSSLWSKYRNSSVVRSDIESSLRQHVRARAFLSLCNVQPFANRVHASESISQMCATGVVPDYLSFSTMGAMRDTFWFRTLPTLARDWVTSTERLRTAIPAEFYGAVFSRGSQMGTLEVACKFSDLMEVPPLLEEDYSSYSAKIDRFYRAVVDIDSTRAMRLLGEAMVIHQVTVSAEEILANIYSNEQYARSRRFWPRFYAARNIAEMLALYGGVS